jgi:tetratricopeptide (TPR) repeat protein
MPTLLDPRRARTALVRTFLLALATSSIASGAPQDPESRRGVLPPGVEAVSLSGEPLAAPPLTPEKRAEREKLLEEARGMQPADSADRAVLIGRRLAHLGRFQEAIAAFGDGIAKHPGDARLWRHRGHRYITTRRFDLAIKDLEQAVKLIEGKPDEIEPDVQPNPKGGPVNTTHSSIWYHLGLAHYLAGDWSKAARGWSEGVKIADNPDKICSTSYWLYLALRKSGKHDEARKLLDPIKADWKLVESGSYQKLLLVFRGELKVDEVLEAVRKDPDPVPFPTVGYGLATWLSLNGEEARADALRREVAKAAMWPAFGRIAAEVELKGR